MSDTGRAMRDKITLAASSGVLLGLAFPPIPMGITALVGFIPFFFLMDRVKNAQQAFRYSYLTFLVFNLTTVYWISGWGGQDVWLMIAGVAVNLVHPLKFCIPALIYYRLSKRFGSRFALGSFPFVWTAWEWSMQLLEVSFPWIILANSQTYALAKIQFIEYTGAFGLTFWIVTMNVLLHSVLVNLGAVVPSKRMRALGLRLVLVLAVYFLPDALSFSFVKNDSMKRSMRVGIAQPDIDPYDKWGGGKTTMQQMASLLSLYDSLTARGAELVLFPETAIPFRILMPGYESELDELRHRIDSAGVPLLTGFPDTKFYTDESAPPSAKKIRDSQIRFDDFNSAMIVLPRSGIGTIYHKIKLTPMSERIPYLDAFPFLADALTWGVGISNWGIGKDTVVFTMPSRSGGDSIRLWSMICYETLYPRFVSEFSRRGSDLFTVITNDGWFGNTSGPYQLQRYAVLRAVENRRDIARCANNGISCFIDRQGNVTQETKLYTRTSIVGSVALNDRVTFYAQHGDWLPLVCAAVAMSALLGSFIIKRKRREDH